MTPKFHSPFSPIIMETEAPERFIDIINNTAAISCPIKNSLNSAIN